MLLLLALAPAHASADGVTASTMVYVDDDDTQVVTPRVQLDKTIGEASLSAGYAADVWTSASIDVTTAATEAITEQRDELFASGTLELEDTTLSAGYRLSAETDYVSHGGSASVARDLADGAATVEGRVNLSISDVGRSGDPTFSRSLFGIGGRLSWTQVLTARALVQLGYEIERLAGFQSSPYRWVALGGGGDGPLCAPAAIACAPERHPDLRVRHSIAARGRYALPHGLALGAGYRFYLDDWGIVSHTIEANVRWGATEGLLLGLRYRLYVQGAADFTDAADQFGIPSVRSSDRELFSQVSHRLMLEVVKTFHVGEVDLRLALEGGATRFDYDGFGSFDALNALTVGFSVQVER